MDKIIDLEKAIKSSSWLTDNDTNDLPVIYLRDLKIILEQFKKQVEKYPTASMYHHERICGKTDILNQLIQSLSK